MDNINVTHSNDFTKIINIENSNTDGGTLGADLLANLQKNLIYLIYLFMIELVIIIQIMTIKYQILQTDLEIINIMIKKIEDLEDHIDLEDQIDLENHINLENLINLEDQIDQRLA